jgi:hypothetical protein
MTDRRYSAAFAQLRNCFVADLHPTVSDRLTSAVTSSATDTSCLLGWFVPFDR